MQQRPSPAPSFLEAQDISRTYSLGEGVVRALDRLSVRIGQGEFVAIMGASGSGKSTLLAILGCLDRPTDGRYLFDGVDVGQAGDSELAHIRNVRIGFVFQAFNLLPHTSALENVAMPLDYLEPESISRAERTARAREALRTVGLAGQEGRTPTRLSGGQQQRVAIARALVNNPQLILADEPTGNLDTRTSHEIMDLLARLNRDRGITIVMVTHEADIAAYANRLIVMSDGRIVEDRCNEARGGGEAEHRPSGSTPAAKAAFPRQDDPSDNRETPHGS